MAKQSNERSKKQLHLSAAAASFGAIRGLACATSASEPQTLGGRSGRTARDPLNAVSTPRKEHAMSKVVAIMSMSLDGYVADLNDGVAEVFDWYLTSGDVEIHTGGSDPMTFKVSQPSADHLQGLISELGAMLTGRRTFDKAQGWGGNHAWGPAFVLTHQIPAG
jgi:hypothetical protein